MTDRKTVKARYPNARIGEMKLFSACGYAVFEGRLFDHMISMGWWSTKDKAWANARAFIEAELAEGSTKS